MWVRNNPTPGPVRASAGGWSPHSFVQSSANASCGVGLSRISQNTRHLLKAFLRCVFTRNQTKCGDICPWHFTVPHSRKIPQIHNALFHFLPPSSPPYTIKPQPDWMNLHPDVKLIQKIQMDSSIQEYGLATCRSMNHL